MKHLFWVLYCLKYFIKLNTDWNKILTIVKYNYISFFKKNWRMRILGAVFFLSLLAGKLKKVETDVNKFFFKKNGACVLKAPRIFLSFLAGKLKFSLRVYRKTYFKSNKMNWFLELRSHDKTKRLILQYKLKNLFNTLQKRRTKEILFSRMFQECFTKNIKFLRVSQAFTVRIFFNKYTWYVMKLRTWQKLIKAISSIKILAAENFASLQFDTRLSCITVCLLVW